MALSNPNYLANNLIDLVSSTTVRDGAGTQVTQTTYSYDGVALQGSGVTTQRNQSPPNGTYRGNLTSVSRWLNTTGGYISNSVQYYDTGLPFVQTDPQGHTTTTEYSLTFAGAYPTKVTNHLGHFSTSAYDFNTGLPTSSTDPNSQTTTFTYDHLSRSDLVNSPDGGQVNLDYTSAPPFKVTATVRLTASSNMVEEGEVDGLGRLRFARLLSDPQGTVVTETTYDALGRKATVSNPYRSTGDPTYGLTRLCYDALGRTRTVTPPDGTPPAADCSGGSNLVTTDYSGNMTTVTDQAGKQRRSFTDALGRLIQVDEPNPTLSTPAATTYTYDTLDNLTGVTQSGSRQRTFVYNSLSQLTSATNPESGTIAYSYDNDGNLSSKTDARGVIATHSYDALHRLTNKSFSDGTPSTMFGYDQTFTWGTAITNGIGRLTTDGTYDGSGYHAASFHSYDAMGRPVLNKFCPSLNCVTGNHNVAAAYDLAGNLTSLTYPSGRKVKNTYDAASRLTQVNFDSWNGTPVNYNYVSNIVYHPHGAPHTTALGNGGGDGTTYTSRLQPNRLWTWGSLGLLADVTYGFNHGTANNGNVASIWNNLTANRSQSFTYDHLNRLATAQTAATSGSDCWGYQYGYDVWANLLSMTKVAGYGSCQGGALSQSVTTANRISGISYDAAGNQLGDGSGATYQWDAESRMKSLNTTGATYTYDANGMRVRKQSASETIEYIYFGGQVIAERNVANGDWSDYIYAGGRRLAKADSFEDRIRIWGTRCSGCGYAYSDSVFAGAAGLAGYTLRAGDKLQWLQWQDPGSRGGLIMVVNDGSTDSAICWNAYDQDGQLINSDSYVNQWHYRRVDLSAFAGKSIVAIALRIEGDSSPGATSIYYTDIALVSADGTVRAIYHRQKTVNIGATGGTGFTGTGYEVNHVSGTGWSVGMTTQYYHGDHLGSSRMMSSYFGYPVWEATYRPYGEEHAPQSAPGGNHYKFTGKERDAESGLDYFGARFYSGLTSRWLSPDDFENDTQLQDPQSWNLYSYVGNNPLNYFDPTGESKAKAVRKFVNKLLEVLPENVRQKIKRFGNLSLQEQIKEYRDFKKTVADHVERKPADNPELIRLQHELKAMEEILDYVTGGSLGALLVGWNVPGADAGEFAEQAFGSKFVGGVVDFFNPASDIQAVVDLIAAELVAEAKRKKEAMEQLCREDPTKCPKPDDKKPKPN